MYPQINVVHLHMSLLRIWFLNATVLSITVDQKFFSAKTFVKPALLRNKNA